MKKIIFFIAIFLYADISNILLKIKEIEKSKKIFLPIPQYNIFTSSKTISITAVQTNSINIPIRIYAIFNNLVNINGKWYKVGDNVNGYKVVEISNKNIVLKKDSKYIILKPTIKFLKVSK